MLMQKSNTCDMCQFLLRTGGFAHRTRAYSVHALINETPGVYTS